MKIKLEHTLAALGLIIVTLTFANCGNGNGQDGSHNMGDNRNYEPMQNKDMPARTSTGTAPSSAGSHNMGDNKNYQPMSNEDMPGR